MGEKRYDPSFLTASFDLTHGHIIQLDAQSLKRARHRGPGQANVGKTPCQAHSHDVIAQESLWSKLANTLHLKYMRNHGTCDQTAGPKSAAGGSEMASKRPVTGGP